MTSAPTPHDLPHYVIGKDKIVISELWAAVTYLLVDVMEFATWCRELPYTGLSFELLYVRGLRTLQNYLTNFYGIHFVLLNQIFFLKFKSFFMSCSE